jgi:thiol-disulfide isomerase/thioredoxin
MRTIACLGLLALASGPAAADDEVGVDLPAPSFTLKTLTAEVAGVPSVSLEQYVGAEPEDPGSKLVLLSFFASWCGPCQKELPFLVQLDRMYREQGLRVVAVSIDQEPPAIEKARSQVVAAGASYPVLSDRFNFVARRYLGEKAPLPSVFLIGRDGNVRRIERGYTKDAPSFLLAEVQAHLGLKATRATAATQAAPARAGTPGMTPAAPPRGTKPAGGK